MIILKIFQSFLMPSGFIFLLVLLGILFLKRKKRISRVCFILALVSYYIFSITLVTDFLLMALEEKYRALPVDNVNMADKIVLLLGGRESNVLRGNEVLRIWHLRDESTKIIISGTDPLVATSQEASAVRNFFIYRGVNPDDITIEGKSRNTRENVTNVKNIVGESPFFLVTSAYHMDRSLREFERLGANPIPAPTDFKRKRVLSYGILDFIPNGQNLRNADLAFHEHIGIIYYRLMYIFGK